MTLAVGLFIVGLFLSAFFSGSETGFYRATRVRLVLDGLAGDRVAKELVRLTNHPSMFVATSLIGNNLANYLTSLAIVLGVQYLPMGHGHIADLLAPIAFSPVIFVFGELLPKALFFDAPNRLLRKAGPLFLLFTVVFLPLSALLWGFGRVIQSIVGEQPLRTQLKLARKELKQVIEEGHSVGLLRPSQVQLTQTIASLGPRPVGQFARPVARVGSVPPDALKSDVVRMARRQNTAVIPVRRQKGHELVGYVRVIDLQLSEGTLIPEPRKLLQLSDATPHIAAITRMQREKEELASITDSQGNVIGLLYLADLIESILQRE